MVVELYQLLMVQQVVLEVDLKDLLKQILEVLEHQDKVTLVDRYLEQMLMAVAVAVLVLLVQMVVQDL
jgi:hypothetical protein